MTEMDNCIIRIVSNGPEGAHSCSMFRYFSTNGCVEVSQAATVILRDGE